MAVREMRASWRRLVFFFLCIALGVGAIVTLRSVIQSVRQVFAGEARALITADAIITSNQAFDPAAAPDDRRAPRGRGATSDLLGRSRDDGARRGADGGRARTKSPRIISAITGTWRFCRRSPGPPVSSGARACT